MALEARLAELTRLRDQGIISESEYQEGRTSAISGPVALAGLAADSVDGALSNNGGLPLQTCRKGHPMTFGTMLVSGGKRQRHLTSASCFWCMRTVTLPAQYYACHTCHIAFCEECVAARKNDPPSFTPMGFSSSLFGCFSDMGSCMDSLCYPCFVFYLQAPDLTGSAGCGAYCIGSFVMLHEIAFLGLPVALVQCGLRQRVSSLYLHRDPEGACTACLVSWIFRCCSVSQIYREMRANGHDVGGLCCTTRGADRSAPINLPMGSSVAR